jgi:hypothetical protein
MSLSAHVYEVVIHAGIRQMGLSFFQNLHRFN